METVLDRRKRNISCLFPELLTIIFCFLDVKSKGRAAQVCAAWRDAAYAKAVWKDVEAELHLRRSNLSMHHSSSSLFPSLIKRGIKRIQILSLRKNMGLRDVLIGFPSLERLNLRGCYSVTDRALEYAFKNIEILPELSELNLSLCKQISDFSLVKISEHLPNLTVLDLGGCSNVTNDGLLWLSYSLKDLRSLNLRSCSHISDVGLAHLAACSHEKNIGTLHLEHFVLQDCQKLTDISLKYISSGFPKLKSINLSFCGSVTDTGLRYLSTMRNLQDLNLRSCDNISDIGIGYLSEGSLKLISLDISFCERIEDQAMVHLSEGLLHLKSVSLSACTITDEGIKQLVSSLHDLTTLNIGQCIHITDYGIELISLKLKSLESIDLYGCTKITKTALEKILKLPKLTTLNLGLWQENK